MPSELILPPGAAQGHVKIELVEEATGRILDVAEGENYIARPFLTHNKWRQRQEYISDLTGNDVEPINPLQAVMLFATASGESEPSGTIDGLVTAWVEPNTYSGADTYRGTLVPGESYRNPSEAVYVFEWPTTAGNGTVRAASWGRHTGQYPNSDPQEAGSNPGLSGTSGAIGFTYDRYSPDTFWALVGGTLNKYQITDWGSKASAAAMSYSLLFTGPSNAQMGVSSTSGVAVDDTHVYVVGGATTIRKFTKPTGSGDVTESAVSVSGVTSFAQGIAYDGSYLWVVNGTTAYRVNKSSGAIERSFTVGAVSNGGVSFNIDRGWLVLSTNTGTYNIFTAYNIEGNVVARWCDALGFNAMHLSSWLDADRYLLRGQFLNNTNGAFGIWNVDALGTRFTLGSDIEKTNLTAMKLTYTFTFS